MVAQVDTGRSQAEQKLNISVRFNKTAVLCGFFNKHNGNILF